MAVMVLPDGSVVIRREDATIHVDAVGRALHLRTGTHKDAIGGILLASYLLDAIEGVRIVDYRTAWDGEIKLRRGDVVSLGRWPSRSEAERTVGIIAELVAVPLEVRSPQDDTTFEDEITVPVEPVTDLLPPSFIEAIFPRPGANRRIITVRAETDVASLVWRSPNPTRYFVPAPGAFAESVESAGWHGARKATGAFVRAISRLVPVAADVPWPELQPAPQPRYFAPAPGLLSAPSPIVAPSDGFVHATPTDIDIPWASLVDAALDTVEEAPAVGGPPKESQEPDRSDEQIRRLDAVAAEEVADFREPSSARMERLRAAVGPWREPTPPPRFPPLDRRMDWNTSRADASEALSAHEAYAYGDDDIEELQADLTPIRRAELPLPDAEDDGVRRHRPEADWAISYYQTVSTMSAGGGLAPELPSVRTVGPSDEDDSEDLHVTDSPYRAPLAATRRPAAASEQTSTPPAILEIPGFNDGTEATAAEPPTRPMSIPPPIGLTEASLDPATRGEALLELVRLTAEVLPIAVNEPPDEDRDPS